MPVYVIIFPVLNLGGHLNLVDVSDIFYFFCCAGVGEKEEAFEEVAGGSVLIKSRGREGGFPRRRRGRGKGAGGMSVGRGGWAR